LPQATLRQRFNKASQWNLAELKRYLFELNSIVTKGGAYIQIPNTPPHLAIQLNVTQM